jgi:hypothetical protein
MTYNPPWAARLRSAFFRLALLPALLILQSVSAQSYSINWCTFDGGGGGAGGGVYSLAGTIGQPDAGAMANAPYALAGGFWSVPGTTPAQTSLRIWLEGSDVIVAWPLSAGLGQLQHADNVATPGWADVSETPVIVGDEYQVTVPRADIPQFFRLIEL